MFERRWQPAGRLPTEALHVPGLDAEHHTSTKARMWNLGQRYLELLTARVRQ
jgi:hypothetical protein